MMHVDAAAERVLLRPHADAAEDGGAARAACARRARSRCSSICAASSRVGVRMSARVVPRGLAISRWRIGSRKAAVLPLPVIAQASTSRPSRAGGMRLLLDGRGAGEAELAGAAEEVGMQIERGEGHVDQAPRRRSWGAPMARTLVMPEARVELARGCPRRILSPLRLPFRHSGRRRKTTGGGGRIQRRRSATAGGGADYIPARRQAGAEPLPLTRGLRGACPTVLPSLARHPHGARAPRS